MNSDIKIIIRRLVPLIAAGISYLLIILYTLLGFSSLQNREAWKTGSLLLYPLLPLIVYSYIYMWMYDRLRQKYKRWKILTISILYFFTMFISNPKIYATCYNAVGEGVCNTTYMIPFIILLLYTDKYRRSVLKTEIEFYKFACWLSPLFAALISSFLGRIRFWLYQFIYRPGYEGSMEDIFPYDLHFWAAHFLMLVVAWLFILIYKTTKDSRYRLFFRIIGVGVLSVVVYWYAAFDWKDYYFGIWGIIRFEIPFLILFFTAQKHIK